MDRRFLIAVALLWSGGARPLPPPAQERVVEQARALLEVPYRFGGRLKNAHDGIDCQGLVFFALQPLARCGWRSYSVFPTQSLPADELGARVAGPVATRDVPALELVAGDVVWLVSALRNPAEDQIGTLDGAPIWVWHTGIATGGGAFVHADAYAGKVIEVSLHAYLVEHAEDFAGVIVTRMAERPKPARCKHHAPMRAPVRKATTDLAPR